MRKFFLPLILLSLSASTAANAQQPQRSGTPEEQAACSRDVQRYCRPLMDQGDFVILACLQQNRPKLTRACEYGAEKPRAIDAIAAAGDRREWLVNGLKWRAGGIRPISRIALVLPSYSPIWGLRSLRIRGAAKPCIFS